MPIYQALTDRLKTQHFAIENILNALDNERMLMRPQPTKWNIHDNVAHLARYQTVFLARLGTILLNDHCHIDRYVAEDDTEFEPYRKLTIALLLQQIKTEREKIVGLVTTLSEQQLLQSGIHTKFGVLNIIQWTEFFLLHEAHHIYTIFQLTNDTEML